MKGNEMSRPPVVEAIYSISKTLAVVCIVALLLVAIVEYAGAPMVDALAGMVLGVGVIVLAILIGTLVWGGK